MSSVPRFFLSGRSNNGASDYYLQITSRFTADVVFNCIYGIEANCLDNQHSPILQVARSLFRPSPLKLLYITLKSVFPYLFRMYDLPFVTKDITEFFVNLTDKAMGIRKANGIQRDDYLNFLLQMQKRKHLDLDDMTAHTITFFLDGYETSSIVLSHALYQLAKCVDVQTRLRDEINAYGGEIDYETVTDMQYLDQVLNGKQASIAFAVCVCVDR